MDTESIKKLGTCPICKKGSIVQGSLGYSCNYFKSMDDKCSFNIYHTYFGKQITEELATKLIQEGETEFFDDLQKKDGTRFSAKLAIVDGLVKPVFNNKVLEHKCPNCGGKVEELLRGYACENYIKLNENTERVCTLFIPKKIAGREITEDTANVLLQDKKTNFLSGFSTKSGEKFSARLIFTDEYTVSFSSSLCKCPKCGGEIFSGKKAYSCSNYKSEDIKCDFVIWKEMLGRIITPEEVVELIENKETKSLAGFTDKEGNAIERKLIINDDFKVKLV